MADLQIKIIFECTKGQVANQVHYPVDTRPLGIHNFNNRLVITEKQDALVREGRAPQMASNNQSKKLLPCNANTRLPKLLVSPLLTMKPLRGEDTSKTYGA